MFGKDSKELKVREKQEVSSPAEQTKPGLVFTPAVDIFENDKALVLLADLPGVDRADLDVDIEDRQLTITGKVSELEDRFKPIYAEYGIGGYSRSFRLGDTIDQSKISASLKDGVLTLMLPKAEQLKPRKVEITSS